MDKRIDRIKNKQVVQEARLKRVEEENQVLKKSLALILAKLGLTQQEFIALKPIAIVIYNKLNNSVF